MKKLLLTLLILGTILLDGCRTYVPIVERSHDIEVRSRYDSVAREHVRVMQLMGDTILRIDSVIVEHWRVRCDTIEHETEKEVPVEVPPKDYNFCKRCTQLLFGLLGLALLALILYIVVRVYIRR